MARPRRGFRLNIREPVTDPFVVYRVVKTDDRDDEALVRAFRSRAARGLPPRPGTAEEREPFIHQGVSAFTTLEGAKEQARTFRDLGQPLGDYVATVELMPGEGFRYAEWGRPGHLTVSGDPVKLRDSVVDIVPVEGPEGATP